MLNPFRDHIAAAMLYCLSVAGSAISTIPHRPGRSLQNLCAWQTGKRRLGAVVRHSCVCCICHCFANDSLSYWQSWGCLSRDEPALAVTRTSWLILGIVSYSGAQSPANSHRVHDLIVAGFLHGPLFVCRWILLVESRDAQTKSENASGARSQIGLSMDLAS